MGLMAIISFSLTNTILSQSIQFQYSQNGILISKQIDLEKKDFVINGDTIVCKSKVAEFTVSTGETARWSNGVNGIKASYTITNDIIIKAIVTNKYGCEFEKTISVKAVDLPTKPVIVRNGNTLSVSNVTGNFEWFRNNQLYSVGSSSINPTLEGIYTVKVININRCENISDPFNFQNGGGSTPPPWTKVQTSENHTVIIPANVQSDIADVPLKSGDYIGVFFQQNGQAICSNFEEWTGAAIGLAAYGNDATAPTKNGFNPSEVFRFKIWRGSESKEYDVTATFEDPPQFPRDATDNWKKDGLSLIKSLITSNKVIQIINLRQNWNTISAYVIPDSPNMIEILASLGNKVVLIKDENGEATVPAQGINKLGNWDVKKGYQIRVTENTTLSITGTKVNPSVNPIALTDKWKIISYLCDNGNSPSSQFGSVASSIVLVKDQDGKNYIPSQGADGLKCLKPGFGYHVRGINNSSFTYNCAGNCTPLLEDMVYSRSTEVPYNTAPLNSGNNATLVFTKEICHSYLKPGHVLYALNSSGMVCGKWEYDGNPFGMPVWGDDMYTDDIVEGLSESESMIFKVKSLDGKMFNTDITFSDSDSRYTKDGIYYVSVIKKLDEEMKNDIKVFPNPSSQWVNITYFSDEMPQNIEICIFDIYGKLVQKFENQNISDIESQNLKIPVHSINSGVYLFRTKIDKQIYNNKILITH